jgi:hypothetical protein
MAFDFSENVDFVSSVDGRSFKLSKFSNDI